MKTTFVFNKYVSSKLSAYQNFISILLDPKYKNDSIEFISKIISEIQIIALILSFPFDVLSGTEDDLLGIFIQKLACYISFDNFYQKQAITIAWNAALIYVSLHTLAILCINLIIVVNFFQKKAPSPFFRRYFIRFCLIHSKFIFLLLYQFSIALIITANQRDIHIFKYSNSTLFTILGVIYLVPNLAQAIYSTRFCYQPIKSNYKSGTREPALQFTGLLLKVIDPILAQAVTDTSVQMWFRIVPMLLITSYRVWNCVRNFPYFHYRTMRIFQAFYFFEFALVISNFAMILISKATNISSFSCLYLGIMMGAAFIKISDIAIQYAIGTYGLLPVNKLTNSRDFFKKIFALEYIIEHGTVEVQFKNRSRKSHIEHLFYGILRVHKNHCIQKECGCRYILAEGLSAADLRRKTAVEEFKFVFLREVMQEAVHAMPSQNEVKLFLANFLFMNKVASYGTAITLIHNAKLTLKSAEWTIIAKILLQLIEKRVPETTDSPIDMQELVDYHRFAGEMRNKIEENINSFIHFWETYNRPDPLLKELRAISAAVNKQADEIQKMWETISTKYQRLASQEYLLYGLYRTLVRCAPSSAEKVLQKYFSLSNIFSLKQSTEQAVTIDNLHETRNLVVYISMAKENLGDIIFHTPNIESLLEYTPADVSNKNVDILMSSFFQERHQSILIAHIERSRSEIFNRNRQLFAQKKSGYIIPVYLYVSMFPYFQTNLIYVGILRPLQTFDDYILVLPNGHIDSFSENVGRCLNLDPKSMKKYSLKHICPQLERLHRAFNFILNGQVSNLGKFRFGLKKEVRHSSILTPGVQKKAPSTLATIKDIVKSVMSNKQSNKIKSVFNNNDRSHAKFEEEHHHHHHHHQEQEKDAKEENKTGVYENENWKQLYEQFTSIGVPMKFWPFHSGSPKKTKAIVDEEEPIEFNTIIKEEKIYGAAIRVFKLQSMVIGSESEIDDDEDTKSPSIKKTSTSDVLTSSPRKSKQSYHITEDDIHLEELSDDESYSIPQDRSLSKFHEPTIEFKNPFPSKPAEPTSPKKGLRKGLTIILPKDSKKPPHHKHRHTHEFKVFNSIADYAATVHKTRKFLKKSMITKKSWSTTNNNTNANGPTKTPAEPTDHKDGLQKFIQQHKMLKRPMEEIDRSSVSSAAVSGQVNSKMELAIHSKESDITISILNIFIVVFALISIVLMGAYLGMTNSNLNGIKDNVGVLEESYSRLYLTIEINRKSRMINLLERGLVPVQRHTNDYTVTCLSDLEPLAGNLSYYNNHMRTVIHKVNSQLQDRFFTTIDVDDTINNKIRVMNTFDTVTELVNSGLRLYSFLPDSRPAADDSSLYFILNNTLNGLYVRNEEMYDILVDDNSLKLNQIQTMNIVLIVVVLVIAMLIFIIVVRKERLFIKKNEQLYDGLFRIDKDDLQTILPLVRSFHSSLTETNKQDKFIERVSNHDLGPSKKKNEKDRIKSFKTKSFNRKGLNDDIRINIIMVFIFLSVFSVMFWCLLIVSNIYNNTIAVAMDRIVKTNSGLVDVAFTFASLYEYITEDGTTMIKNQPISTQWELEYDTLTGLNDYFSDFGNQEKNFDAKLTNVLSGDLCALLFNNISCYNVASGVASKGITGLNSFMTMIMREVKDNFDSSQRQTADKTVALTMSDLITSETVYESFVATSYSSMESILKDLFVSKVNAFYDWLILILGITGLIFLILIKWVWLPVITRMKNERNESRGMLRLVPFHIIMGNKTLKNYLVRNSKNILGAVKNRI